VRTFQGCSFDGWRSAHYVQRFDREWLGADAAAGKPLLGAADLQSLADLSTSVNVVREMQWVALSTRLLMDILITLLPVLPLLLFKYPHAELVEKFFARLSGM
jgi:hypothetical protein